MIASKALLLTVTLADVPFVWERLDSQRCLEAPVIRELTVEKPYWRFPIDNRLNAPKIRFDAFGADGTRLRSYSMALAKDGKGDWQPSEDVRAWMGKKVTLRIVKAPAGDETPYLDSIVASDEPFVPEWNDPARLQFHFTPPSGFLNDPNGLVYRNGEWIMMFQHSPFACDNPWESNRIWGQAVSTNLVDWQYLGTAARPYPGRLTLISGSGVVDVDGTAGFGKNAHVLCVTGASLTNKGLMLFSSTDGRRYEPYEKNPAFISSTLGDDARVFWHKPTNRWIMATFSSTNDCYCVKLHSSPDLHRWQYESAYFGDHKTKGLRHFLYECPGLEELKIEGEDKTAWVIWGADMEYAVGTFDGHVFKRYEGHEPLRVFPDASASPAYYAAQTFQNAPDGRVVQIPWYRVVPKGLRTYNQAMGLPVELTLRRTNAGLRMARTPVRELESLRLGEAVPFDRFEGELAEMHVSAELTEDAVLTMDLRGLKVTYDARRERLSCGDESVYWPLVRNRLDLRLFLDRAGLECFSSDGLFSWAFCRAQPEADSRRISASTSGGARQTDFHAWKLRPMRRE